MGKLLLLMFILILGIGFTSQAQNTDTVKVVRIVDDMSNDVTFLPNRKLVVSNDNQTKGIIISCYFTTKDTLPIFNMITTKSVGIGSCHENDVIIILFDDGEKITKGVWNKFNCKGNGYFNLKNIEIEMLRTKTISKIRLTNGRTYENYTGIVDERNKDYFIQLFQSLDSGLFETLK